MRFKIGLFLFLLVSGPACTVSAPMTLGPLVAPSTPVPPAEEQAKAQALQGIASIPFKTVDFFKFGMAYVADRRVIQSATDAYMRTRPLDRAPLTPIDYTQEIGILVAFGDQPSGMIDGEIYAIEDLGDRLRVHSVLWVPPPERVMTADVGNPVHYVSIPKTDKLIEFAPTVTIHETLRPRPQPSGRPLGPTPTPPPQPDPVMTAAIQRLYAMPSLPFTTVLATPLQTLQELPGVDRVFQTRGDEDAFFEAVPSPRRPETDYSTQTVIVKDFGAQGSIAMDGSVVALEDQGTKVVVHAVLWEPPPGTLLPAMVGYPYHMIRTPKIDKPVEFAPVLKADSRLRRFP